MAWLTKQVTLRDGVTCEEYLKADCLRILHRFEVHSPSANLDYHLSPNNDNWYNASACKFNSSLETAFRQMCSHLCGLAQPNAVCRLRNRTKTCCSGD